MKLEHRFVVPAPPEAVWEALDHLDEYAPCLPGAALTGVDGDEFTGTVKVKLGPVSMTYSGTGRFIERDTGAGQVVVEAKGKDKRGNGTAGATVTAHIVAEGDGTAIDMVTDLSVTGKPAQFGRGVIQDISDKLLGQFVECFSAKLAAAASGEDAAGTSGGDAAAVGDDGTNPVAPAAPVTAAGAKKPSAPTAAEQPATAAKAGAPASTPAPAARPTPHPVPPAPAAELDLMSTVMPVILRRYAPAIAFAAGLLLGLLLRRRSR